MDAVKAPPILWATLGLVLVASVGTSWKSGHDTRTTNHCVVRFIAENSRVSQVRSAATAERDEAINALLDGVSRLTLRPAADPGKDRDTYKSLLTDYRAAAAKLKAERAANPLPNFPASCADLPS